MADTPGSDARPPQPDAVPLRNTRPILKAVGLTGSLVLAIFVGTSLVSGGGERAMRTGGQLAADAAFGGIAFAIWAANSKRRWSALGLIGRFLLCVLVASGLMPLLSSFGRPP